MIQDNKSREQNTAEAILKMYVNFINHFGIDKDSIFISPVTVLDVSKRYWKDVDTMKSIHNIQHPNCYKVAGYTTYWISKLKPITIVTTKLYSNELNDLLIRINEYFSFYVSAGSICSYYTAIGSSINFNPSHSFVKNLIYTLRYRVTTGENLSLIYQSLETTNTP